MGNHLIFDVAALFMVGWLVKSYFLHKGMTQQEAFLVREAPRWLLYSVTILVMVMLLIMVAADFSLVAFDIAQVEKYTIVSFMLWVAMTLYVKWNWGVHLTDQEARTKNKKEMVLLLILLMFFAMMVSQ